MDPFVEIRLHVPEWTSSPFLPESTKVAYSAPTSATPNTVSSARTLTVQTSVVKNNGFNPMWRESFSIPFDCIGDMRELIFVEFAVRHQNGELLGMSFAPLACLEQGMLRGQSSPFFIADRPRLPSYPFARRHAFSASIFDSFPQNRHQKCRWEMIPQTIYLLKLL